MTSARVWVLRHDARPLTLNAERSGHWRTHRATTAEWRNAFRVLALAHRVPRLDRIAVDATPIKADRRGWPDVAACVPAAKAAIDGLVDAGVLVDDTDRHVVRLTFHPCRLERGGTDAFELRLTEVTQ